MSIEANAPETPRTGVPEKTESPAERRLDRAADEASEKAGKTEQRYDQDHEVFTN